mmetsp:Transcript_87026/g.274822  ORF Transcript_87026/g.274822 Transcript_87026/m.274822 type:complete len:205 (+) Transcript_87026:679-1293(+)
MRLLLHIKDTHQHALRWRGSADEALTELQKVHEVVQATAAAADTSVGHEKVLFDADAGVHVHHAPSAVGDLDVADVPRTDRLDDPAGASNVHSDLVATTVFLHLQGVHVQSGVCHDLLQLAGELLSEARWGVRLCACEPEHQLGLRRMRGALLDLAETALSRTVVLQRHEAHGRGTARASGTVRTSGTARASGRRFGHEFQEGR